MTSDLAYPREGTKSEKVLSMVRAAGADRYLSGPSAKVYLDESIFGAEGIAVEWMDYQGYGPYLQLHGEFEHAVTSLDLLFNTGPDARKYLKLGAVADGAG